MHHPVITRVCDFPAEAHDRSGAALPWNYASPHNLCSLFNPTNLAGYEKPCETRSMRTALLVYDKTLLREVKEQRSLFDLNIFERELPQDPTLLRRAILRAYVVNDKCTDCGLGSFS